MWKQPIPTNIPELNGNRFRQSVFWHILIRCANKDQEVLVDGVYISLKKGQCTLGRFEFAEEFGVSRSGALRVWREIEKLEKVNKLLNKRKSRNCSVITVINYDHWVSLEQTDEQSLNNHRTITEQSLNTNKSVKSVKSVKSDKSYSKPERVSGSYQRFIDFFNELTGRKFGYTDKKAKRQYEYLVKQKVSRTDFETAIRNAYADDYHVQSNFKYLTPEFITRPDKFERYKNLGGVNPSTPALSEGPNPDDFDKDGYHKKYGWHISEWKLHRSVKKRE